MRGSRLLYGAGLLALAVAAAILLLVSLASGWTTPPAYSRQSAVRALAGARVAGAAEWAPWSSRESEALMREAELEFRRQELRWHPFRDFREARRRFGVAEGSARLSEELALRREQSTRESARHVLDVAGCVVRSTEALSRTFSFGDGAIEMMSAARLHFAEAELLWNGGEFDRARLRSDQAIVESRTAWARMAEQLARFVDLENVGRWKDEQAQTIRWSAENSRAALIVNKDKGTLTMYVSGRPVATYEVECGMNQLERKTRANDTATPEGRYHVTAKKGPGQTKYYKALGLDYPNEEDRRRLRRLIDQRLLPRDVKPGELIEIHGAGGLGRDWTHGCVSLPNEAMDDLFAKVPLGTPVTIVGGSGNGGRFSNLAKLLASSGVERECRGD